MRYKRRYEYGDWAMGYFFGSDVKKLASYRRAYPSMTHDDIRDLTKHINMRSKEENSLFFSIKHNGKVWGYGAFDPIGYSITSMHIWKRPKVKFRIRDAHNVVKMLLEYAFEELQLARVSCGVHQADHIGFLLKLFNFKYEGTLRSFLSSNDEPVDLHLYGMLKEEFKWAG